jgi:hypothetical protein
MVEHRGFAYEQFEAEGFEVAYPIDGTAYEMD